VGALAAAADPLQHNPKWFRSVAAGSCLGQGALAAERRQLQALVRPCPTATASIEKAAFLFTAGSSNYA